MKDEDWNNTITKDREYYQMPKGAINISKKLINVLNILINQISFIKLSISLSISLTFRLMFIHFQKLLYCMHRI